MPITALPTPPQRSDSANFASRGDAFMTALPTFATEANALATAVNADQVTATSAASTATTQAGNASTSASNASTSASTATTQAGIATTQAGIATTQASNALASANAAAASAAVINLTAPGPIGSTTPSTGAFTTMSVSNAAAVLSVTSTTGINSAYANFTNTGGSYFFGVENSTGSTVAATPYAAFIYAPSGKVIQQNIAGTNVTTVSSTGLAVTGVSSASGMQVTSNSTNSTGSGVEILGGGTGTVQAYNRTGGAYINMSLDGLSVAAKVSGTTRGLFDASGLSVTGASTCTTTMNTGGYTVATLPAGSVGDRAYVTDATAPTFLGALTGGGAVRTPVFKNASAWVAG